MRQYTDQIILLNAAAADGASGAALFADFRNVELEIAMAGFTGTVKVVASNADARPAFGSGASASNPWDYVKCINQIDGSAVNGGTGVSGTATTSITQLELNTNAFKWVGVIVSGYSAGAVTVKAKGVSND